MDIVWGFEEKLNIFTKLLELGRTWTPKSACVLLDTAKVFVELFILQTIFFFCWVLWSITLLCAVWESVIWKKCYANYGIPFSVASFDISPLNLDLPWQSPHCSLLSSAEWDCCSLQDLPAPTGSEGYLQGNVCYMLNLPGIFPSFKNHSFQVYPPTPPL